MKVYKRKGKDASCEEVGVFTYVFWWLMLKLRLVDEWRDKTNQ